MIPAGTARKHSKKRDAILQEILATKTHPSAKWVHERLLPLMPGLSLGTVYRNIGVLKEEGALVSVGVVSGEERFDGTVKPHPHFVCDQCGAVIDLGPAIQLEITRKLSIKIPGCIIDKRKTMFYGLCKACAKKDA
jgi:Fur family peroxide stress response transcriptional regulator